MASPVLELSLEQELERSFTICQSARCCDDGDSEDSLKVQNADGGHLYSSEHDNYSDPPRRSKRLRSWANLISLNIHHRDHTLRHPSVTLGRDPSNTIVLPRSSEIVSKLHCRIWLKSKDPPTVFIEDSSFNGTFVNGVQLKKGEKRELRDKDAISLGVRDQISALKSRRHRNTFHAYYVELDEQLKESKERHAVCRSDTALYLLSDSDSHRLSRHEAVSRSRSKTSEDSSTAWSTKRPRSVSQSDSDVSSNFHNFHSSKRNRDVDSEDNGDDTHDSLNNIQAEEPEPDNSAELRKTRRVDSDAFAPRRCIERSLTLPCRGGRVSGEIRLSGSRSQRPFFEVLQEDLLHDETVVEKCNTVKGKGGAYYNVVTLRVPHVADMSYGAHEFKKAELAFRRFVSTDRKYKVTKVDVIFNTMLEARFRTRYRQMKRKGEIDILSEWENKPLESFYMKEICRDMQWCHSTRDFRKVSAEDVSVLAWHGTSAGVIGDICAEGFKNLSSNDEGWFGRGMYFTQLPNYGEFYIGRLEEACSSSALPQSSSSSEPLATAPTNTAVSSSSPGAASSASLLLCWLLLGRVMPVTDDRYCGEERQEGYDSHYALVKNDFSPLTSTDDCIGGDEIVVFDSDQILPRYVVHYDILDRDKFIPFENETKH